MKSFTIMFVLAACFSLPAVTAQEYQIELIDMHDADTFIGRQQDSDNAQQYDIAGLSAPNDVDGRQQAREYLQQFLGETVPTAWGSDSLLSPKTFRDGVQQRLFVIADANDPELGSAPYAWSWKRLYDQQ